MEQQLVELASSQTVKIEGVDFAMDVKRSVELELENEMLDPGDDGENSKFLTVADEPARKRLVALLCAFREMPAYVGNRR
eukprot:755318-Hanusia_phi.AAC.1